MVEKKTGTHEWSEITKNIQVGCEHGCLYCFARLDAVSRFKRCTLEQWNNPVINQKFVDMPHTKKYKGTVMFPSTHDITSKNINECIIILKKLLDVGNNVLIVSKPHWGCITFLCEVLTKYKEQIMFRFTIGSASNDVLAFWEPNAPNLTERLECLHYAHKYGYKTSVSCEPMLDAWPHHVYVACEEYVTDTIWFGKMRNMKNRVDFTKISAADSTKYVLPLVAAQCDPVVLAMVEQMKDWPKVRWKDSIQAVIDKNK